MSATKPWSRAMPPRDCRAGWRLSTPPCNATPPMSATISSCRATPSWRSAGRSRSERLFFGQDLAPRRQLRLLVRGLLAEPQRAQAGGLLRLRLALLVALGEALGFLL